MKQCLELIISGRVQGVGYRWFAREQAVKCSISGYVKNLPNGDVKVMAEGDSRDVAEYLSLLRKGPSFSMVTDIKINELPFENRYENFEVTF